MGAHQDVDGVDLKDSQAVEHPHEPGRRRASATPRAVEALGGEGDPPGFRRGQRYVAGTVYLGLGVATAVSGRGKS